MNAKAKLNHGLENTSFNVVGLVVDSCVDYLVDCGVDCVLVHRKPVFRDAQVSVSKSVANPSYICSVLSPSRLTISSENKSVPELLFRTPKTVHIDVSPFMVPSWST
eukprot:746627-Amphidinium_carterae.1